MLIKVYQNIQEMSGIGEEWLLDSEGDPIAVFFNGNLKNRLAGLSNKNKTVPPYNIKIVNQ